MYNTSKTTRLKTIRIKNETADFFADKPLNRIVESVHGLAEEKKLEIQGDGKIVLPGDNV